MDMRIQVSIDAASLATLNQFDTLHNGRGQRHLLEADFLGDIKDCLLMLLVSIRVH